MRPTEELYLLEKAQRLGPTTEDAPGERAMPPRSRSERHETLKEKNGMNRHDRGTATDA